VYILVLSVSMARIVCKALELLCAEHSSGFMIRTLTLLEGLCGWSIAEVGDTLAEVYL